MVVVGGDMTEKMPNPLLFSSGRVDSFGQTVLDDIMVQQQEVEGILRETPLSHLVTLENDEVQGVPLLENLAEEGDKVMAKSNDNFSNKEEPTRGLTSNIF
jgi:hypothetical protein